MKLHVRYLWAALDVGLGRSYGHDEDDDGTQNCILFQIAKGKAVGIPAVSRAQPIFQFLLGRVRRKRPMVLRSRLRRRDCLQKTSS